MKNIVTFAFEIKQLLIKDILADLYEADIKANMIECLNELSPEEIVMLYVRFAQIDTNVITAMASKLKDEVSIPF